MKQILRTVFKHMRTLRHPRAFFQDQHRRLEVVSYDYWVWSHRLTARTRAKLRHKLSQFSYRPLLSVLIVASDPTLRGLRRSLDSVGQQLYPHWEVWLVLATIPTPAANALLAAYQARFPQLHVYQQPSAGTPNAKRTLEEMQGEYIVFLHLNDQLATDALYRIAEAVNAQPDVTLLYSDEDSRNRWGRRVEPRFKPDWSPHLLRSHNYIGHLLVMKATLIEAVGGLPHTFSAAHEYDLILRAVEPLPPTHIYHIRRVLYHRRRATQSDKALLANDERASVAQRAVENHLQRCGIEATVAPIFAHPGLHRLKYPLPSDCRVSVIVPTRDRLELLQPCVTGVLEETDYPNLELIILDNGSVEPATQGYLAAISQRPNVQVIGVDAPFNFSALCNLGARAASGDLLCFLNNDIKITQAGWLRELATLASQPEVGAVGPLLRYPDGRIQHMGIRLDTLFPQLIGDGKAEAELQSSGILHTVRNVAAVTGGCLVTRRAVLTAVGGFDEALAVAYNDVDLCLSLRRAGYWIVWTPFAELVHLLSATRTLERTAQAQARFVQEIRHLRHKWPQLSAQDPFSVEPYK